MSIVDDLNKINGIKNDIRIAIANKGVDIPQNTPFADYPSKIDNITGSGSGSGGSYHENLYNQMTNDGYMMYGLFAFCQGGQLDLTGLDFSKAENASFMFYECNANLQINNKVNTSNLKTAMNMFYRFTNGNNYIDLSAFDFSNVYEAERMFAGCNLNNIDIRNINLNLGNVYQKYNMFNECTGTLDLSNWNIDGVREFQEIFSQCYCTKINLTNWNTINVGNMRNTFFSCPNLQELIIPNWNMDNAYDYWDMFDGCNNLRYVDVRNCNEDTLYKLLEQLPTKSKANYGEIELPEGSSQDIIDMAMNKYWKPTSLEATPVTSCNLSVGRSPIAVGESTTVSLSNYDPWYGNKDDIILVSSDEGMIIINGNKAKAVGEGEAQITAIDNTTQATIGYTSIEVTAEDMNPGLIMFKSANRNIQNYNNGAMQVNNVEYRTSQLSYDENTGVYSLDIGEPITQFRMYSGCYVSEIVKLNVSNMTNMNEMFNRNTTLKEIDANNWVTPSVTEANIFRNCSGLEIADISNWDTSGLRHCSAFLGCTKLHTLRMDNCNYDTIHMITQTGDFPRVMKTGTIYCREGSAVGLEAPKGWVFSYVGDEPEMPEDPPVEDIPLYVQGEFEDNTEITEVRTMVNESHDDLIHMFDGCTNLMSVNTLDWDTSNVTDMGYMFYKCSSLTSLDISNFVTGNVTNMSNMFNGCNNLEELDIRNFNIVYKDNAITPDDKANVSNMFNGCTRLKVLHLENCSLTTVVHLLENGGLPARGNNDGIMYMSVDAYQGAKNIVPDGWTIFTD